LLASWHAARKPSSAISEPIFRYCTSWFLQNVAVEKGENLSAPPDATLPEDYEAPLMTSSAGLPAKDGHGPAVFAGFLGWTLDAFDFFLVVLSLTAIAKEFHRSDAEIAFSITLTLMFRPVGAFIFGLMADRYGRRIPLMIDLVFYSVVEVATGFAHSFTTFLVLRALFGIGMGGEWGVGASLAMEKVPPKLRGFLSGMLQQGYALGYLLAAVCFYFVFPRWGWRPMFFIGGLPALLGLFVRFKVKESEVWKKTRQSSWSSLGREILSHWKLFLYLTLLMMMMNFASHGTQDMFPTFLQRHWGMGPTQRAVITAISMVGAILGGLLVGLLSDRFGRRKAMVASLVCAVALVPLWAYAPSLTWLVIGAFLIQFMVQGAWGIIPAHLSELSPDSVRGFLPGFAYQCGVLLAGSVGYVEAILAQHTSYANAMALTAFVVFILAAAVVALGRENRGIQFGS
jgi:SHS family lactate transporter-like MFS transporter